MTTRKLFCRVVTVMALAAVLLPQGTIDYSRSVEVYAAVPLTEHTLGNGGKVTTAIGSGADRGKDLAIQADGRIVVAGYAYNGTNDDFAVVRYNTDGSLDTTFGSNGKVTTDFGYDDQGRGVAIQTDGKIVVVGHSGTVGTYYGVWATARYNNDGSLDTTFGTGGKVTTDIGSSHDWPSSVVIQSDGKIVVGGSEDNKVPTDFALARYNSDGSLDTSFGASGIVDTPIGTGYDEGNGDLILQTDGKIILTGWAEVSYDQKDFALVRYNSNGSLDTTFDDDGKVTTDLGTKADYAWAAALQIDGKIILAGYTYTGNSTCDIAMARYSSDGSLDTTFGSNGTVVTHLGSTSESALGIALQTDGKIVLAGYSGGDFVVLRYNSDGSLDATFGSGGHVTTDFGSGDDYGEDVVIQTDGKIVVAGYAYNGTDDDFAVVRYNTDGDLDTTFGGVSGEGVIVFTCGSSAGSSDTELYRVNPDGSNLTRLTNNSYTDWNPRISPDGSKIAFCSNETSSCVLSIMDIDGGNVVTVTNQAGPGPYAWSPDGAKIAFAAGEIYTVELATGRIYTVTSSGVEYRHPDWSPDGTRLAVDWVENDTGVGLAVLDLISDTQEVINYTQSRIPDWNPDGQRIAYERYLGHLHVITYTDHSDQSIPTMMTAFSPRWSPGGTQIAYATLGNGQVGIINAGGTDDHPVPNVSCGWIEGMDWGISGHLIYLPLALHNH